MNLTTFFSPHFPPVERGGGRKVLDAHGGVEELDFLGCFFLGRPEMMQMGGEGRAAPVLSAHHEKFVPDTFSVTYDEATSPCISRLSDLVFRKSLTIAAYETSADCPYFLFDPEPKSGRSEHQLFCSANK